MMPQVVIYSDETIFMKSGDLVGSAMACRGAAKELPRLLSGIRQRN
jgi:hypothetical protein